MRAHLETILFLAGIGQLCLAAGSLAVPGLLSWDLELKKVQPLIRQLFLTYAAYIFVINICFGLISVFAYRELMDHSVLASCCTAFIAVYWISRVLVQFLYFDRESFPKGAWHTAGEIVLVTLFIALSIVYSGVLYLNLLG